VYEVIEIIKSREFVKHLITFDEVLPSLMAAESYDKLTKKVKFDNEIYDPDKQEWNIEEGTNQKTGPSYIEAHKSYLEMMSISQDKKTGLISISVEHISPILAQSFLSLIIKEANNLDREIDIESSSKALNYLKTELSQTSLVEIKKSINQLIEAQLETRMMASIHEEYSLISLEPPYVPEEKSKPVRSQIVILATILGGLLSAVVVLIRYFTSRKKLV